MVDVAADLPSNTKFKKTHEEENMADCGNEQLRNSKGKV